MTFATPTVYNATALFTNANTVTDGAFWNWFMIILFAVFFLLMKAFTAERAVVVAAFVCAIAAFFFAMAGLVNPVLIVVFTIAIAVGLMFT